MQLVGKPDEEFLSKISSDSVNIFFNFFFLLIVDPNTDHCPCGLLGSYNWFNNNNNNCDDVDDAIRIVNDDEDGTKSKLRKRLLTRRKRLEMQETKEQCCLETDHRTDPAKLLVWKCYCICTGISNFASLVYFVWHRLIGSSRNDDRDGQEDATNLHIERAKQWFLQVL